MQLNFRKTLFPHAVLALMICGFSMPTLEAAENYWVAVDHPNASDSNNGLSLVNAIPDPGPSRPGALPGRHALHQGGCVS